jgi:hypothetical protein
MLTGLLSLIASFKVYISASSFNIDQHFHQNNFFKQQAFIGVTFISYATKVLFPYLFLLK